MSGEDIETDPLAVAVARYLTEPLLQAYALLWRLGLVHTPAETEMTDAAA